MPRVYRLAVLADIHGNLPAFQAVMADLKRFAYLDGYLVAGDVLGGPGQEAILQHLMALHAVVAHGNGEVGALEMVDGLAAAGLPLPFFVVPARWRFRHQLSGMYAHWLLVITGTAAPSSSGISACGLAGISSQAPCNRPSCTAC